MIRIIRFLITGSWHEHKWEEIKQVTTRHTMDGAPDGVSVVYHLQCKDCGKITSYRAKKF
jgi:hypothetical protein